MFEGRVESIVRTINVKEPVLFSLPDLPAALQLQLVSVSAYSEAVWFANPSGPPFDPTQPPAAGSPHDIAIPIPHSSIQFSTALSGVTDSTAERQTEIGRAS